MLALPRRTPVVLETSTSLRGALPATTPIHGTTGNWYAQYALEVPPPIGPNDVFLVSMALHVTNDAFRPDPNSVTWEVQVRFDTNTDNTPGGSIVLAACDLASIGDEAHHAKTQRSAFFSPGGSVILTTRYFVMYAWFRHSSANGSQNMTSPDNGFGIQAKWYRSL